MSSVIFDNLDPVSGSLAQTSEGEPTGPNERYGFRFNGQGWDFFTLMLKHILLNIVTLGIFLPWAKSEKRAYVWQNIEIFGQPLRYHGTGKELFFGYLKVVIAWVSYVALITIAASISEGLGIAVQVVLGFGFLAIIPGVIVGARAYLLSRTSWRGIFFGFENVKLFGQFTRLWIGGYLLTILTLGFYGPVWTNEIYRYMTNNTRLGGQHFEYRGENGTVFKLFLFSLPLIIVTFGLYYFWYGAKLVKYQMSETYFMGAEARSELTGGDILWLFLVQIFGTTLTLGLGLPWVMTYSMSYTLERLSFVGNVDFGKITQESQFNEATADSFADAMDIGIGL